MLDNFIGGYGRGHGHKNQHSSGYDFVDHKEFVSHEESGGGYFDRQGQFEHHMRLPAKHGRPTMAHMPVCEEEDSDVEEFFESSRSQHSVINNHNRHHQQPPPLNFMPPPPMPQHHHSMSTGWHEDAYHGGHGMQHHGGHEMQHHGGHGMKHHDRLMAPQVAPRHGYMNPMHDSGGGHAVVVKASENWSVSNSSGGHHKAGWGSKGL